MLYRKVPKVIYQIAAHLKGIHIYEFIDHDHPHHLRLNLEPHFNFTKMTFLAPISQLMGLRAMMPLHTLQSRKYVGRHYIQNGFFFMDKVLTLECE